MRLDCGEFGKAKAGMRGSLREKNASLPLVLAYAAVDAA
jgi:hypothetical protein